MLSFLTALVVALSVLVPQLYSKEVPSPIQVPETIPVVSTVIHAEIIEQDLPVVTEAPAPAAELPIRTNNAVTEENIWIIVNEKRQEAGLPLLVRDERLNLSAQMKSDDMATRSYFAHANPEGEKTWKIVLTNGYGYRFVGENLALHYTDVEAMMDGWMLSEKHRNNILADRFTDFGVGITAGTWDGFDTIFVTTLFGTER